MHPAIRPYVTAGVVLGGASVIAVAPIAPPPPPDYQIPNPAVQLAVNPFELVFGDAFSNLRVLLDLALEDAEDPAVTLEELLATMLDDPRQALDNFVDALDAIGGALLPLLLLLIDNNSGQLVGALDDPVPGDLEVAPIDAIQNVINALDTGDPEAIVNALIAGPAVMLNDVLNEYTSTIPDFGPSNPGGPTDPVKELAQLIRALATPPSTMMSVTSVPSTEALKTVDVATTDGLEKSAGVQVGGGGPVTSQQAAPTVGAGETAEPEPEVDVKLNTPARDLSDGNKVVPRLFGGGSAGGGSGAGLSSIREGIRDTVQGIRTGVRDAVGKLTGQGGGDAATGSDTGAAAS